MHQVLQIYQTPKARLAGFACKEAQKLHVERFCSCRLSKKPKYDKRLAVTVFSFPPDKGNVGTAAYLNVFGSIYRVLQVRFCMAPHFFSCAVCMHSL